MSNKKIRSEFCRQLKCIVSLIMVGEIIITRAKNGMKRATWLDLDGIRRQRWLPQTNSPEPVSLTPRRLRQVQQALAEKNNPLQIRRVLRTGRRPGMGRGTHHGQVGGFWGALLMAGLRVGLMVAKHAAVRSAIRSVATYGAKGLTRAAAKGVTKTVVKRAVKRTVKSTVKETGRAALDEAKAEVGSRLVQAASNPGRLVEKLASRKRRTAKEVVVDVEKRLLEARRRARDMRARRRGMFLRRKGI